MITINNVEYPLDEEMSIPSIVNKLKDDVNCSYILTNNYIVVVNGKIVPYRDYENFKLKDGDRIMVVPQCIGA